MLECSRLDNTGRRRPRIYLPCTFLNIFQGRLLAMCNILPVFRKAHSFKQFMGI